RLPGPSPALGSGPAGRRVLENPVERRPGLDTSPEACQESATARQSVLFTRRNTPHAPAAIDKLLFRTPFSVSPTKQNTFIELEPSLITHSQRALSSRCAKLGKQALSPAEITLTNL